MKDSFYLFGFLIGAVVLLFLGRDQLPSSTLLTWGLTFGATTAAAILMVSLYRVQLELQQSRRELARKTAELGFAREVQAALFPRELPLDRGLQFAAVCIPAQGISGDYYDVVDCSDGKIAVAVADVSGKGVSAAILMSNLQARLQALLGISCELDEVCSRLNAQLHEVTEANRYVTAFISLWDSRTRRLRYVNAGHLPPQVFGARETRLLNEGGPPLGMFPAIRYRSGEVALTQGDLVVLYSDGITEAENAEGEHFGRERLERLVESNRDLDPAELQEKVLIELKKWSAGEAEDDVTLFIMRVTGGDHIAEPLRCD